jgi:hypothetical protein
VQEQEDMGSEAHQRGASLHSRGSVEDPLRIGHLNLSANSTATQNDRKGHASSDIAGVTVG